MSKYIQNRVLIVSHSTQLAGAVELLESYLVSKKLEIIKLEHPLLNYSKTPTKVSKNLQTISVSKRRNFGPLNLLIDMLITLRWLFKLKPETYIGGNNFDAFTALVARKLRLFRPRLIIYYASDYSENRYTSAVMNYIYNFIETVADKNCDLVINNTNRAETKRLQLGLTKVRSVVIPNGIKMKNENFKMKNITSGDFIYVGSLTPGHGLRQFIETHHKLIQNLIVIGDGPERVDLVKLLTRHRIKHEVLGAKSRSFIIAYLQGFNGFGLAPYNLAERHIHYGSSLKLVEYIACGVPPITSPATELADYIKSNHLGIVCDVDNKAVLKKALADFSTAKYHLKARNFYSEFCTDKLFTKIDTYLNLKEHNGLH